MAVIKIENLWKQYRLGVINHGTLSQDLQSWLAKIRGKDDPNEQVNPLLRDQKKQIEGDRFWALRNICIEVEQGQVLGIVGKNGAGKSTLLKILSRVTAPTRGKAKIKGRIASLLEVGTGFHPELTGRENIFLNGAILGMRKAEIKKKFDEIVAFAEMDYFLDTPVKRYSSGMRVRLAFAVAAHLDPEILVIDEVLAVGDVAFQNKCLGKMENVAKGGRTILFVSHNMPALRNLCPDSILLDCGELIMNGATSDVLQYYLKKTTLETDKPVWIENGNDSGQDFIIKEVKVHNDKGQTENIYTDVRDIYISIRYRLSRSFSNLRLKLRLLDTNGAIVLTTRDTGPILSGKMLPGEYVGTCHIPHGVLNEGEYSVLLSCVVPMVGRISPLQKYVNFSVKRVMEVKSTSNEKFYGVLNPFLCDWELSERNK